MKELTQEDIMAINGGKSGDSSTLDTFVAMGAATTCTGAATALVAIAPAAFIYSAYKVSQGNVKPKAEWFSECD